MNAKTVIGLISSLIIFFTDPNQGGDRMEMKDRMIVPADHPSLIYQGRFDFSELPDVYFDWPGVSISLRFRGSFCAIALQDTTNYYQLIIDQKTDKTIPPCMEPNRILAQGLQDTIHTIQIYKRTEAMIGLAKFSGFYLNLGAEILPSLPRSERRLEFIGNSITCGYGNEGTSPDCSFTPQTENNYLAYPALLARTLGAEYHIVAYSGKGVVRNYNDTARLSPDPMPLFYHQSCFARPQSFWDFSRWIPQGVIINLGTNDYSTKPYPSKTDFTTAYMKLIATVRHHYPQAHIFCICGPLIAEPCLIYIRELVQNLASKDKTIHLIPVTEPLVRPDDLGCDSHPNLQGQKKIAEAILPILKKYLNWK